MDIIGHVCISASENRVPGYSGALFNKTITSTTSYSIDTFDSKIATTHAIGFQASKNWTGSTSSNGAHTHTLTTSSVNDFSVFGKSDTVQPNALKCRVKTRFI